MLRPAALALTLASPAFAEDRALIVGIEGYPQLDLRLAPQSAKDDAIAFAEMAVTHWGYQQTQVSLLLDSAATSDAILNALIDELVGQTGPGDRALLYFAGVGSRNTQGKRVLLAYDSESLLGRIPEDAISDILDLIADRDVTVIVDAGFSGDINTPGQRGVGAPGFETTPFAANGDRRAVYAASSSTQTAWETASGGVLTTALLAGAKGAADTDSSGTVTHHELQRYIAEQSRIWCDSQPACTRAGLSADFAGPVQSSPTRIPPSANTTTAPDPVANSPLLPNPAVLEMMIDGGTSLSIGQSVTFRVQAAEAGTFVLLDIAPDGQLTQIFPSRLAPGTSLTPNQVVTIPAERSANGSPLRVRVTGPTGQGLLIGLLVAGDQPDLTAVLPKTASGDTERFLTEIAATLDTLANKAGATWSATTLTYTISQD